MEIEELVRNSSASDHIRTLTTPSSDVLIMHRRNNKPKCGSLRDVLLVIRVFVTIASNRYQPFQVAVNRSKSFWTDINQLLGHVPINKSSRWESTTVATGRSESISLD